MKKIIFFPGWPKMESLLKPFLDQWREVDGWTIEVHKQKTSLQESEKVILVSYSAGVIELLEFLQENWEKVGKIILIAPAGLTNRGLIAHCMSFLREVALSDINFSSKKKIMVESVVNLFTRPRRSWKEINEIRKFNLKNGLKVRNLIEIRIVMPFKDDFITPQKNEIGKMKSAFDTWVRKTPGDHFGIIKYPDQYRQSIKEMTEK